MERKLIAAAVTSALALPLAAQAVEFSVSGHVNRSIVSVDGGGENKPGTPDDYDGDVEHIEGNMSPSRFRITGSEELENGMTAGVNFEAGVDSYTVRHSNVYLNTAGGKISIGHTSAAADGMAHANLGGPSWMAGVTNYCAWGVSNAAVCSANDGGRHSVLRYDTPSIGPASIAVSTGNNDYFDIKLSIAGSMGDAGYDFRIGHIAEYEADVPAVPAVASMRSSVTGAELRAELLKQGYIVPNADGTAFTFKAPDGATDGADNTAANEWADVVDAYKKKTGITLTQYIGDTIAAGQTNAAVDTFGDAAQRVYFSDTAAVAAIPATTMDVGDITTMSGAVSFGQGTSVAATWSQADTGSQVEYQYMELDHSYGDGSIGVYYKTSEYGAGMMKGVEGSMWGIGIGHSIGGGAHVYAGYRQIEEDKMKDIDLLVAGMRVTFN